MIPESSRKYDDLVSGFSEQITNAWIMFYTCQSEINVDGGQSTRDQDSKTIQLLFNKTIIDSINRIFISNQLISSNAKVNSRLLTTGLTISQSKDQFWDQFLAVQPLIKIRKAFNLVCREKQAIIKYSVLSISNLLFKLSVNMSKISIIPFQKLLTFESLNIPILSILFLQFMEYSILPSKQIHRNPEAYMADLPTITIIRLGKYINNTEHELIETNLQCFFAMQGKSEVLISNIQFIDIHEQDVDPFYPTFQQKTQYQHIRLFCIGKIGMKPPFGFQIVLFMDTVIYPLIRHFNPSIILYIQDYPCNHKIMDQQIRALMLSQLAQQTNCNKIHIFKQIGFDKSSLIPLKGNQIICEETASIMQETQYSESQKLAKNKPQSIMMMNKTKKILVDDLWFIALVLIQKTGFESVLDAYHQYFHPVQCLKGLTLECESLKNIYSHGSPQLQQELEAKQIALNNMIDMTEIFHHKNKDKQSNFHVLNITNTEAYLTSFYDLLNQTQQILKVDEMPLITYQEEDYLYVKYYADRLLAFVIRGISDILQMIIMSKNCQDKVLKLEKIIELKRTQHDLQGATYIASDRYLYRAFGKLRYLPKNSQQIYNKAIHRLQIHPFIGNQWILVSNQAQLQHSMRDKPTMIELEQKLYGYGFYEGHLGSSSIKQKNNAILLMGGYLKTSIQQKISTKIYMILDPDNKIIQKIQCIGKTNKLLFLGADQPIERLFLHPFVYGIPFKGQTILILNGNGNFIHLNNAEKVFITVVKISGIGLYNGITEINKLRIPNQCELETNKAIFMAQFLNKILVYSPYQHNILGQECCIQTIEERSVKIKVTIPKKSVKIRSDGQLSQFENCQLNFI